MQIGFDQLSFALGITAILIGGAAIYFSWELFKITNRATIEIEKSAISTTHTVDAIRTDIQNIVNEAVRYWTALQPGGTTPDTEERMTPEATAALIDERLEAAWNEPAARAVIGEEVTRMTRRVSELEAALREARAREIFPGLMTAGTKIPAVAATKTIIEQSAGMEKGTVEIHLMRPLFSATATVHFSPHLPDVPTVRVERSNFPADVVCWAGGANPVDLNLHFQRMGSPIDPGIYTVHYEARWSVTSSDRDGALLSEAAQPSP